jgi:RNA polymerase sigma-54 factor
MQGSETSNSSYVIPDFSVRYVLAGEDEVQGDFEITLNRKNAPSLRISPSYKQMWQELQHKQVKTADSVETQSFIKTKMESAKAFIEALQQRQHTLMNVMRTIVALQETFFREGTTLKPMILKDIADRVKMDISTISRVVNGKYVQTPFGVYELKYFFNEGVETSDGEMASNRDVKLLIADMIVSEDKKRPLSDDAIADELKQRGYLVARRTVSKYREQMDLPVARLRKTV